MPIASQSSGSAWGSLSRWAVGQISKRGAAGLFTETEPIPPVSPNLQLLLWLDGCSQGQSQRGPQPYLGHAGHSPPPSLGWEVGPGVSLQSSLPGSSQPVGEATLPASPFLWLPTLVPGCVICPALGLIQPTDTQSLSCHLPGWCRAPPSQMRKWVGRKRQSPEVTG